MAGEYPQRDQFFAHKFVRLLHKAAIAAEIGRDAFSLLTVVVHTEDAMRYRGPAKFWNSQLIETLGFAKWETFDRARTKAIESGWLQYSGNGKRTAGEYFVTVPDGYEQISDAPIEPKCTVVNPEIGYEQGYKAGYKAGYEAGMIEGIKRGQSGVRSGDEQGEPSNPIPNPIPSIYPQSPDVIIPESVNVEPVRKAVSEWLSHLQRMDLKNGTSKAIHRNSEEEQALWRMLSGWKAPPEAIVLAINTAIQSKWQNLRQPEQARQSFKAQKVLQDF